MDQNIDNSLLYTSPSEKQNIPSEEEEPEDELKDEFHQTRYTDIFKEEDFSVISPDPRNCKPSRMSSNYNGTSDGLSFSDRVFRERRKLRRNESLPQLNSTELYGYSKHHRSFNKIHSLGSESSSLNTAHRLKSPHELEAEFTLPKDDSLDTEPIILPATTASKYADISAIITQQINEINQLKRGRSKKLSYLQNQLELHVSLLKQENEKLTVELSLLRENLQSMESDLIVERKHNQEALNDKVQLQNKISLYSRENQSLTSSQEIMQNMHKNEIDELNNRKLQLSNEIVSLQNDIDYLRDNLQEAHKLNENLKIEINNILQQQKKFQMEIQRLRNDNKRLSEDISFYKIQNHTLIETNERLRCRNILKQTIPIPDDSCQTSSTELSSLSIPIGNSGANTTLSNNLICGITQTTSTSTLQDDDTTKSIFTEYSDTNYKLNDLDICETPSTYSTVKPYNPTSKWVVNHVSKHSSVDSLQQLKDKLKDIASDDNFVKIDVNSSLKTIKNNSIKGIQEKLEIISQQLNNKL